MPATLTKEDDKLILDLSTARGLEFKDGLDKIRDVPGRKYNPENKTWYVEATAANADRIIHSIQPNVSDELMDWVREERVNASEALTTPLPDDALLLTPLHDTLYPYQRAFVDLAARRKKIIIADDMGLGKTLQTLAAASEALLRCSNEQEAAALDCLGEKESGGTPTPDSVGAAEVQGEDWRADSSGEGQPVRGLRDQTSTGSDGPGSRSRGEANGTGPVDEVEPRPGVQNTRSDGAGRNLEMRSSLSELSPHEALSRGPKLVVCPNSVKGVWSREIQQWLGDVPLQIIDGSTQQARHNQLVAAIRENAWVIVNYEQLRVKKEKLEIRHRDGGKSERTIEVLKEPLYELPFLAAAEPSLDDLDARTIERARGSKHRTDWLVAVSDEAHRIKNRRASQSKGLHRVRADIQIAATGTPIFNAPDELWSILHWLWPEEYTSYWRFYENYVDYTEGYFGKVITGVRNPDALRFELRDRLVRRTKDQVLDLPEKTRVTVPVTLTKQERKLYDELETQVWVDLAESARESGDDVLAAAIEAGDLSKLIKLPNGAARMVRLQQFLEHPSNIDAERVVDSSKLKACEEIILDNRHIQHVVFVKFKHTATVFAEILRASGLRVGVYTGDVDPKDRDTMVEDFQRGDLDILVGTMESMYQGLTLTASSSEHFITRSWVPAINEQAEDRCHRVGQRNPITIHIYEGQGTVDDGKVRPTNRLKEGIVKTVLQKDEIKEITHS